MATVDQPRTGEVVDDHEFERVESSATLMALNASEIDTQIATAKRYPRSITQFLKDAREMVTMTEDIAGECIYALPRDGKSIEGPSARFAEILISVWGNCRAGARVVSEDDRFVTSQGVFLDLQHNTAITYEVRRRITNSRGQKYKDDMIGVTSNAASSIALRNAVLKGIPKAFWRSLYELARKTAVGDATTLATRRASMIAEFGKMGVLPEQMYAKLGVVGANDITLDHIALLRGIFTALREGDTTIEQVFAPEDNSANGGQPRNLNGLTEALKKKAAAQKPANGQQSTGAPTSEADAVKAAQDAMAVDQRGPDDDGSQENPAGETPEERRDREQAERDELERKASGKPTGKGKQRTAFSTNEGVGQ